MKQLQRKMWPTWHLILAVLLVVILGGCLSMNVDCPKKSGGGLGPVGPVGSCNKAAVTAVPNACDASGTVIRLVTPKHSEATPWCWASTAQMIMGSLSKTGTSPSQCQQADDYYRNSPCCSGSPSTPTNEECKKYGGWPRFGNYGYDSTPPDAGNEEQDEINTNYGNDVRAPFYGIIMDWVQLTEQICQVGPFAYSWYLDDPDQGRLGHMVVAGGHTTIAGKPMVHRIDPCIHEGCPGGCCTDERDVPYDEYVDGPVIDQTVHWVDYKDIAQCSE